MRSPPSPRRLARSAPFAALAVLAAACGLTFDGADAPPSGVDAAVDATVDAPRPVDAARDTAPADATVDAVADATVDATGDATVDAADAADATVVPAWEFDWTAIVGTGQSLSVGSQGLPVLSTVPSFNNLKLDDTGPDPRFSDATNLVLVPLSEPIRPYPFPAGYTAGVYPANIRGETPHTAMASQITTLARARGMADLATLHSVVGSGGKPMSFLAKGGTGNSYDRTLYEGAAFQTFATAAAKRLGYGAVILTHGEADAVLPSYEADLIALATNYDADLRALTGQTRAVPLFVSQQHSIPRRGEANLRSTSTLAAWTASRAAPGLVVCLGPKYQYAYVTDRVHLDAFSYRRLGLKHGQAFFQHAVLGKPWRPLEPTAVSLTGRVLRVTFNVPTPPLAWDAVLPTPHPEVGHPWALGKGFEVEDSNGALAIEGVAIAGDAVDITLTDPPTGTDLVVRYAMTQDTAGPAGARAGEGDGRMGLLRDSDPFVGVDDEELTVSATSGSATLTGDFSRHGRYELVTGTGLATETALIARSATSATLSAPWTGATGVVKVRVHSNQHNYSVAFELPVP